MNTDPAQQPAGFDGYVFDLDGTVYRGDRLIAGAAEAIATLRRRGARVLFVSNKPLETRQAYAAKLDRLGIPATVADVVNSSLVMAHYLARAHPGAAVYVLGEEPLRRELRAAGLRLCDDPLAVEIVVVSFDRTLTYEKLNIAYQALLRGARFVATNPDRALPVEGGTIPDTAANIAALEATTGRTVEVITGKPHPLMIQAALEPLGLPPEQCLMVGDRLETDVLMGQRAGMWTALVLTGVAVRSDIERLGIRPDFVCASIAEIPRLVRPPHAVKPPVSDG
ncbi:MAG: HAD family hydrolase [Chloroflexota bacterium]